MKNNIKLVCGILVGFILGSATMVFATQAIQASLNDHIKIMFDGELQSFKDEATGETQYPITYNNRTYLPLRNLANLLGVNVDYDVDTDAVLLGDSYAVEEEDVYEPYEIEEEYDPADEEEDTAYYPDEDEEDEIEYEEDYE